MAIGEFSINQSAVMFEIWGCCRILAPLKPHQWGNGKESPRSANQGSFFECLLLAVGCLRGLENTQPMSLSSRRVK